MREMYHELYEVKKQRKLPIKWMAPEAIYEQIFTSKSDVYVLFLTYDIAEYNTDSTRARNLEIPLILVCLLEAFYVYIVSNITLAFVLTIPLSVSFRCNAYLPGSNAPRCYKKMFLSL